MKLRTRAGALAAALGLVLSPSGIGSATADPVYSTSPFDIVNNTKYDVVFWDYSSTAKYPQSGPDHGNRAKPGQSFRFELRQIDGSRSEKRNNGKTTIVANFHTFDASGNDIPAGTATMEIRFDADGTDRWSSFVNCWASKDRSCGPRPSQPGGQLFSGNVVTFTG